MQTIDKICNISFLLDMVSCTEKIAVTLPNQNKQKKMYTSSLYKSRAENKDMQAERMQELEIVRKVLSGDRDAFRALFDIHYPRILASAKRIMGDQESAADLAQDAFLKAYKNLSSFKGDSSFFTWVYKILVNACIDAKRKSSHKFEVATSEDYILSSTGADPLVASFHGSQWSQEDLVYASELKTAISGALASLSPSHRDVIMMREVEGLSYDDISKLLNCSLGTVMSRLFHARKNLVAILSNSLQIKKSRERVENLKSVRAV